MHNVCAIKNGCIIVKKRKKYMKYYYSKNYSFFFFCKIFSFRWYAMIELFTLLYKTTGQAFCRSYFLEYYMTEIMRASIEFSSTNFWGAGRGGGPYTVKTILKKIEWKKFLFFYAKFTDTFQRINFIRKNIKNADIIIEVI